MVEYITQNYGTDDLVIVSPDAGGAKRCVVETPGLLQPVLMKSNEVPLPLPTGSMLISP